MNISVCLGTYNGELYLRKQLDSVLYQLGEDDEVVVSDDGSTDKTMQILLSYGERIKIVGDTRAGGVVRNFERALNECAGDIIVFCDQDDVWLDGRVEFIRARLQYVTLLMMNGDVVDSELNPIGQDIYQFVSFRSGFLRTFASTRYVGCCMAFRKEIKEFAMPFPENIQWHDWYIALVAELFYRVECTPIKTILFRRHQNNASPTGQISKASFITKLINRYWMARAVLIFSLRIIRSRMRVQS